MRAHQFGRHAHVRGERDVRVEPVLDVAPKQRQRRRVALQRPTVERKEETLETGQLRIGDVGPHLSDDAVAPQVGDLSHLRKPRLGARLDLAHHLQEQAVLRTEVVQQHPVARPDGLGDAPQALVGQAVRREVIDHGVEQTLLGRPLDDAAFCRLLVPNPGRFGTLHVPNGTFDPGPGEGRWPWHSR